MAGDLITNRVQLGDNATAANNFVWQTNVDGTAKLARGTIGATTQDILTVAADGSITIITPLSTDNSTKIATTAFVNSLVPGVTQTWQIVTGSRAFGTTYTNNTGRQIEVKVLASTTIGSSNVTCTISGVAVPFGAWYSEGTFTNFVGHATIPAGATYNIASPGTLVSWAELR